MKLIKDAYIIFYVYLNTRACLATLPIKSSNLKPPFLTKKVPSKARTSQISHHSERKKSKKVTLFPTKIHKNSTINT